MLLTIAAFLIAPEPVTSLEVRRYNTTSHRLVITWGPPSGSNYPTPVTYRVRYRESPSSGPPGSWSSTVVRNATQREYTTPTLKPGTRYEVEVWAVTSFVEGTRETKSVSLQAECECSLSAVTLLIHLSV